MKKAARNGESHRKPRNLDGGQARRRVPEPELTDVVSPKHADGSIVQKNCCVTRATGDGPSVCNARNLDGGQTIRGIAKPQLTVLISSKSTDGSVLHDDGRVIKTPSDPGTVRGVDVRSADGKAGRDVCGFCRESTETPEIPRDGDVRDEIRRHLLLGAAKFLLWD